MTDHDLPRERLARLETKVEHLEQTLSKMEQQLSDVHETVLKAKNAWWVLGGTATVASGVTAFLMKVAPYFTGLPK